MRQFAPFVRLLLVTAVLVLLIAPLSQATDRNDHFTPHDTELNLCALAMLATAGYWAARQVAAGRRIRARSTRNPSGKVRTSVALFSLAQPEADASPPAAAAALLRI